MVWNHEGAWCTWRRVPLPELEREAMCIWEQKKWDRHKINATKVRWPGEAPFSDVGLSRRPVACLLVDYLGTHITGANVVQTVRTTSLVDVNQLTLDDQYRSKRLSQGYRSTQFCGLGLWPSCAPSATGFDLFTRLLPTLRLWPQSSALVFASSVREVQIPDMVCSSMSSHAVSFYKLSATEECQKLRLYWLYW